MSIPSPKYFYKTDSWDETVWLDIVSIEYESLVSAYPFDAKMRELSSDGELKLLDVGCGSAIFPQFLDGALGDGIHIACDLLDVSERSLRQAHEVLTELEHFSPGRSIATLKKKIQQRQRRPSRRRGGYTGGGGGGDSGVGLCPFGQC